MDFSLFKLYLNLYDCKKSANKLKQALTPYLNFTASVRDLIIGMLLIKTYGTYVPFSGQVSDTTLVASFFSFSLLGRRNLQCPKHMISIKKNSMSQIQSICQEKEIFDSPKHYQGAMQVMYLGKQSSQYSRAKHEKKWKIRPPMHNLKLYL